MKALLGMDDFIANKDKYFLVDVRAPAEFNKASIPEAVNIPLFDDEERAIVGTTYWKEGTDRAKLVGLSLVAAKLPRMVASILEGAAGREIVCYCWRGGMRSRSVASVLEALNYPVWQLRGGYKAFRREIAGFMEAAELVMPVYVLNGLTGVGKTLLIKKLQSLGVPALDLEEMANHRGSVFGGVGLGEPRSQKNFEALLFLALKEQSNASFLIVEGEGKRIGPVHLPDFFFAAMQNGPHILLETDLETRTDRIMAEYKNETGNADSLATAVMSLEKRLGPGECQALSGKIHAGEYQDVIRVLCTDYYDRYYKDSQKLNGCYLDVIDVTDLDSGARKVLDTINKAMGLGREE